jgi:phosphoglucomutase
MVLDSLKQKELFADTAIKVAYTPLHGSGNIPVRTLLERLEVECEVVEQQELPDGNFPTVSMPNPEDHQAMRLAIELATKIFELLRVAKAPRCGQLCKVLPQ